MLVSSEISDMKVKWFIISYLLTSIRDASSQERLPGAKCLTGYMTDVQNWVDESGALTHVVEPSKSIDLSSNKNAVRTLRENLQIAMFSTNKISIQYLSMARCNLGSVPQIFNYPDPAGHFLFETIEYMTFYGNPFMETSSAGVQYEMSINATELREIRGLNQLREGIPMWTMGFHNMVFPKLKQLDLRACSIEAVNDYIFQGMTKLEALYLGENTIHTISNDAFHGLHKLIHLDISRSVTKEIGPPVHLHFETATVFDKIPNLQSLDLSFTILDGRNFMGISRLKKLVRMSLCFAAIPRLPNDIFNGTSLRYLDISGNFLVLHGKGFFQGLENSLQILYASETGLVNFDVFNNLRSLEILKINNNDLNMIPRNVLRSLRKLQVLDLSNNRLVTWFSSMFSGMQSIKILNLRENNINIISQEMVMDLKDIPYVALAGKNFMVCNCHSRDIVEMASLNEMKEENSLIELTNNAKTSAFQNALTEYNNMILTRTNASFICNGNRTCFGDINKDTGRFLLLDYNPEEYSCLESTDTEAILFTQVRSCSSKSQYNYTDNHYRRGKNLLLLLIIPGVLLPVMLILYLFRRKLWYFYVTMRNSATLSLISKDEIMDDTKIYNYDVFVSYCQDDRGWMLDQLLPHLETDCSVSVCLHERDFQVGLSILENIVSCMDNSRTIMLIISKKFLKSQWCQFEMHLAQHRLLETRREDLILILLEEIPRRLRPNTLHFLMLTKTYIVWPQDPVEKTVFWRRLKKSLLVQKNKFKESNITLV